MLLNDGTAGFENGIRDLIKEGFGRHRCGIGGAQKHSIRGEQGESEIDQAMEIFSGSKWPALARLGKGGWIEHDRVEKTLLLVKPPQPIEHVTVDEIVAGMVQSVEFEVAAAPVEVFPRQVQARGYSSCHR